MGTNSSWDLTGRKPKKTPKEFSSYEIDNLFEAPIEKTLITKKNEQIQKIEQVITRINEIERKMQKGENYFSLYYDMQKQASKFLEIFNELEGTKILIDESSYKRILAAKEKLERVL